MQTADLCRGSAPHGVSTHYFGGGEEGGGEGAQPRTQDFTFVSSRNGQRLHKRMAKGKARFDVYKAAPSIYFILLMALVVMPEIN